MDYILNEYPFDIKKTTPNAIAKLNEADEMLRKYNKNNELNYLFNEEFRGKYLKAVCDVVMEFGEKAPSDEFYTNGDLEVSTIQDARLAFLGRGGMIQY